MPAAGALRVSGGSFLCSLFDIVFKEYKNYDSCQQGFPNYFILP